MHVKTNYRSKMSHLSIEEIENLKSAYYAGVAVGSLVEKYSLDIHPNSLYLAFPFVVSKDKICKYCNAKMYFIPPPKNAQTREEYFCTTCHHVESIFDCSCLLCNNTKHELKQEVETTKILQSKKIRESALKPREYTTSPSFDMLSVKEKAYLGALLRVALDRKYLLISMDHGIPTELAPIKEYRELIMAQLLERKIITAYTLSKNTSEQVIRNLMGKTLYDICVSDVNKNKEELITHLMWPGKISINAYPSTVILLKEIQIHEAIEYMMLTLQQFDLPIFKSEQRYILLFMQILNAYAQSQLFNFIYTAIRNQAAYRKKVHQTYIPIANYIFISISDRFEKARINNWEITHFRRSWQGQQTELSKIINNRLLNMGESVFYEVIT